MFKWNQEQDITSTWVLYIKWIILNYAWRDITETSIIPFISKFLVFWAHSLFSCQLYSLLLYQQYLYIQSLGFIFHNHSRQISCISISLKTMEILIFCDFKHLDNEYNGIWRLLMKFQIVICFITMKDLRDYWTCTCSMEKLSISTLMEENLDVWIERLRKRQPLEEDELQLLCRIVKDVLFQEPNIVVCVSI